jgi:hypothetical protein
LGLRGTRYQGSGNNYIMRNLVIRILHPIRFGDKIEKNEMGGACSMYEREERRIQGFGGES